MGWSVWLEDRDNKYDQLVVEPFIYGSTLAANPATFEPMPTEYPDIDITYNYSRIYFKYGSDIWPGWKEMKDRKAGELITVFEEMLSRIPDVPPSSDYWEPCDGNARKVLSIILPWAKKYPDAYWNVC